MSDAVMSHGWLVMGCVSDHGYVIRHKGMNLMLYTGLVGCIALVALSYDRQYRSQPLAPCAGMCRRTPAQPEGAGVS